MHRALPLVVVLAGCQTIDAYEASQIFAATYDVSADLQNQTSNLVAAASAKDITVEAADGGWTIAGSQVGGNSWEGTVEVGGAAWYSERTYDLDLDTRYIEVYSGPQDVQMDGDLALTVAFGYSEGEVSNAWALHYDIVGELVVDGSASGDAVIDYALDVEFDGTTHVFTAQGTVAGHEVSADDLTG